MAEAGEGPPIKESALSKLINRIRGRPNPQPQTGEGLAGTRTTEQIKEVKEQIPLTPKQPQERIPAPGDPDYEPLTKETPTPEWERQAQLRYAAEQTKLEQNEPETSAETTQPEQEDTNKPTWLQKEEARLEEGYAKEAISQGPQTTQVSPAAGQPTTASTEQVVAAPETDKSFVQKVLDTPVEELEKELPEGARKALEEAGRAIESEVVAPPPPISPTSTETSVQVPVKTTQQIPTPVGAAEIPGEGNR